MVIGGTHGVHGDGGRARGPSSRVPARLSALAVAVGEHHVRLVDDIWRGILDAVPELRADDLVIDLLRVSVAEIVARLLHRFQHRFPLEAVEAPVAAIEYVRRLAQRGIVVIALVRAYRVGHARYLTWCVDELTRQEPDPLIFSPVNRLMLDLSFEYVDQVADQVVTAYQSERDRWLLSQTAVRAARVASRLVGQDDVDAAENALGYRVRQQHLALMLWTAEPTTNGAGLIRLDRLVAAIGTELECVGRPLFVPRDQTFAWAWLPLGARANVALGGLGAVVEATDATARVAVDEAAMGWTDFGPAIASPRAPRQSRSRPDPGRVTTSAEVGPLSLMCHDIVGTRGWVRAVLGDLAVDDDAHRRLRDTVHWFLLTGGSYAATAAALAVHRNTVQYRLRRAEELLGRSIGVDQGELDLAIRACNHLGQAVLVSTVS